MSNRSDNAPPLPLALCVALAVALTAADAGWPHGACAAEAPPAVAEPAPGQPPALPQALAILPSRLVEMRAAERYFVCQPHGEPLLEDYAAHMLVAYFELQGTPCRLIECSPRMTDNSPPARLPACLLKELPAKGTALIIYARTSAAEGGPHKLSLIAYDGTDGARVGAVESAFTLAPDLQALATGNRARLPARDDDWLALFDRMFPAGDPPDAAPGAVLAQVEGEFLMSTGLWQPAAARLLTDDPPPHSLRFMHGIVCGQLAGLGEEAGAALGEALRLHADSGPLYALKSWLHLRLNQPADALPLLEQARRSDMAREGLYVYAHGLFAAEQDDLEAAEQDFLRAAELMPDALLPHLRLAHLYRGRGNLEKAAASYRRAAATPGAPGRVWAEAAVVLDATNDTASAIAALQTAWRLDDTNPHTARNLASLLRRDGHHEEALGLLRATADASPCRADLRVAYGEAAAAMWRTAEAEKAFRESAEANPDLAAARVGLAGVLQRQMKYQEAKALLTDLLAVRPQCQPARIQLGRLLAELRHPTEAAAAIEAAARAADSQSDAQLALAEVWLASSPAGNGEAAVRHAQIAAAAEPTARSYAVLCRAFLTAGQPGKATTAARSAVDKDPGCEEAHLALALALTTQNQPEEAARQVAKALKGNPYSVAALTLSGRLHLTAGRHEQCAKAWRRALTLNPWDADLHRELARVLEKERDDVTGAMRHYRKCIELREIRSRAAL